MDDLSAVSDGVRLNETPAGPSQLQPGVRGTSTPNSRKNAFITSFD